MTVRIAMSMPSRTRSTMRSLTSRSMRSAQLQAFQARHEQMFGDHRAGGDAHASARRAGARHELAFELLEGLGQAPAVEPSAAMRENSFRSSKARPSTSAW